VKNNKSEWFIVGSISIISSSSFVQVVIHFQPLLCVLNAVDLTLFIYDFLEKAIITSSFGIVSFGLNSPTFQAFTFVLLSSPKTSIASSNSVSIIESILSGLDRISLKSAINNNFSFNSSSIFCLSSQANLFNLISKIAVA